VAAVNPKTLMLPGVEGGDERTHGARPEIAVETEEMQKQKPSVGSLDEIAAKIFDKGAEGLKDSKHRPLKINRDLLLYRAKLYRRKGIKATKRKSKDYWFRKAEKGYRRVMSMDPTDCRAYVGIGRLFEVQKRFSEARKIYEDGCTVSAGSNAFLWTSRGNLEVKENHLDQAREFFKAAIAADRSHEAAWHAWGTLEKSLGDYTTARDCFMKGIRFAKRTPSPYLFQSLALLAVDLGLCSEARKWFRKGTETVTGETSYVIWTAWALLEAKQENLAYMEQLFKKSLELNSKGRYAYLSWARIEQDRGNVDKARELFLEGQKRNRSDPAFLQALAVLESECENYEEARRYFREGVELDSSYQYLWQAWGVLESRLGNYDEARELFQRGVWANPDSKNSALVFQAWGLMEEAVGSVEVARTLYRYGVKVDPKNEALWKTWILLEEKEDNYDQANELRNLSIQERTEVALPSNFSTLDDNFSFVENFFVKFSDWLSRKTRTSNE